MNKSITENLQNYINEHAKMQLTCYNLSNSCDKLGYPGFTHFFQVQAQDEFLHQRRIMNYLLDRGEKFNVSSINVEVKEFDNIIDILNYYKSMREMFSHMTDDYTENAKSEKDYTSVKFYEWFSIDFCEEISEISDIIDWLKMSNGNHYSVDKQMKKRENPDTLSVVDPFAPHN